MRFNEDKHIAFEGEHFRIEWFVEAAGHCEVLDFAESMPKSHIAKLTQLIHLMGNVGAIRNKTKFRHEGDGIYAFKPQPYRFLCFFVEGRRIILTNGFIKKTDKLPESEKRRALQKRDDYLKRVQDGAYYG